MVAGCQLILIIKKIREKKNNSVIQGDYCDYLLLFFF